MSLMICKLPVTALGSYYLPVVKEEEGDDDKDIILVGTGGFIEVWKGNLEQTERILVIDNGIVSKIQYLKETLYLVLGGKSLVIISICTDGKINILAKRKFTDKILEATLIDKSIFAVLAHGQIVKLEQESLALEKISYQDHCESLFYSAVLFKEENTIDTIMIALGTVFNGIQLIQVTPDLQQRKVRTILTGEDGHKGSIFALTQRNNLLASVSDDRSLKVWDLAASNDGNIADPIKTFIGHKSRSWDVTFIDNSTIATAGEDGTLRVWNLKDGTSMAFEDHSGSIRCIHMYKDNLLSGGDDCSIIKRNLKKSLLNIIEPQSVSVLDNITQPKSVAFIKNQKSPIICCLDGSIVGLPASFIPPPKHLINRQVIVKSISNDLILIGSLAGKIYLIEDGKEDYVKVDCKFSLQVTYLNGWLTSKGKKVILAQSGSGEIALIQEYHDNKEKNYQTITLGIDSIVICSSRFFESLGMIVFGSRDGRILCCYLNDGKVIELGRFSSDAITCIERYQELQILVTDRSGKLSCYLIVASKDQQPCISLVNLWQHTLSKSWLEQVNVLENGQILIAGFHSIKFFIMDLQTRREVYTTTTGGSHRAWSLKWAHDYSFIFGFIRLGKVYTVKRSLLQDNPLTIVKPPLHCEPIRAAVVINSSSDDDDSIIATGGEDGNIRVFKLSSQAHNTQSSIFFSIEEHSSDIKGLCFSGNDKVLWSGGSAEQLYGWQFNQLDCTLSKKVHFKPLAVDGVRIMDVDSVYLMDKTRSLIACAYSDSFIRIRNTLKEEECISLESHPGHCVLKVRIRMINGHLLLISAGTDGYFCTSQLSEEEGKASVLKLLQRLPQVHQSGINALDISLDNCLIASGGDDGSIVITRITSDFVMIKEFELAGAHHSTVTGVRWIDKDHFISVGIDQRLRLWSWNQNSIKLLSSRVTQVADAGGLLLLSNKDLIIVFGVGIESFQLSKLLIK